MSFYFLGIAIDDYAEIGTLKTPVNDVKEFALTLEKQYGFKEKNVRLLCNDEAGHNAVVSALYSYQNDDFSLDADDSLIIYFAGHGRVDSYSGLYYWLPHDASADEISKKNWISGKEIRGILKNMPIRHVFLICDTCFSGNMLKVSRNLGADEGTHDSRFVVDAMSYRSREVITSGFQEEVQDPLASAIFDTRSQKKSKATS